MFKRWCERSIRLAKIDAALPPQIPTTSLSNIIHIRKMVKTIVLGQDQLVVPPLPHLKRWCLVGIASTLS